MNLLIIIGVVAIVIFVAVMYNKSSGKDDPFVRIAMRRINHEPKTTFTSEVLPLPIDTESGERLISDEFYGFRNLPADKVKTFLGKEFDWVGSEVLLKVHQIVNLYSKAGFIRRLEFGPEQDLDMQEAAFIICHSLDIPFSMLWEHGFMEEDDVQDYIYVTKEED